MWLPEASPLQKRTLLAASLGWMLDAMDILLCSMVLTSMMRDLSMTEAIAGLMTSLTMAASAVGGPCSSPKPKSRTSTERSRQEEEVQRD
jgi:predicted MFS family arabinose efflux permease